MRPVLRFLDDLAYATIAIAALLVTLIVVVPLTGLWSLVNGDVARTLARWMLGVSR